MSERGSFCTQYIYCELCLDAVKAVLLTEEKGKYLCSVQIPSWPGGGLLPIVAGKIGGLGTGEELIDMEYEYIPAIEEKICHAVEIAVIPDSAAPQFFTAIPKMLDPNLPYQRRSP